MKRINIFLRVTLFLLITPIGVLGRITYIFHSWLRKSSKYLTKIYNGAYTKYWKYLILSRSENLTCSVMYYKSTATVEVNLGRCDEKIILSDVEFQEVLDYMTELNKSILKLNGNIE